MYTSNHGYLDVEPRGEERALLGAEPLEGEPRFGRQDPHRGLGVAAEVRGGDGLQGLGHREGLRQLRGAAGGSTGGRGVQRAAGECSLPLDGEGHPGGQARALGDALGAREGWLKAI